MNTDHLPRPLVDPSQKVGQVAAVLLSPTQAYLGWLAYTVSPPDPQDLWYPVVCQLLNMEVVVSSIPTWEHRTDYPLPDLFRAIGNKESVRVHQFMTILYENDLQPKVVQDYHLARNKLWPNSVAPSA